MLLFFFISLLLSFAVIVLLIRPMLSSSSANSQIEDDASLLYKKRKQELDAELKKQSINQTEYDELLNNYQKELYYEIKQTNHGTNDSHFLSNKSLNFFIVIATPVIAGILYSVIGGGTPAMHSHIPTIEDLQQDPEQLLIAFENKLAEEDGTAEEWQFLAQLYRNQKHYGKAKNAFEEALQLQPEDPLLQADYIEVLMLQNNNEPTEDSTKLLQQALASNPKHPKLLWIAAADASYKNETALQIDYLQQLTELMPSDAAERKTVEKMIAVLSGESSNESVVLNVQVEVKEELKRYIIESSVLFVFAQATDGPRMPLAVARLSPDNIPDTIILSDDMAMAPNMTLSDHKTVNIIALISHSGQAQSSPGDLRGMVKNVATNTTESVAVMIDELISE